MQKTGFELRKIEKSRFAPELLKDPGFGVLFSDHMFSMEYSDGRWLTPSIVPYEPISISPANTTLHYGQAVFEGLKAFRTSAGVVNIFRPDKYFERFLRSCERLCIPPPDYSVFITALTELVKLDSAWVPNAKGQAMYIRPFIFATGENLGVRVSDAYRFLIITSPVGAYYKEGMNPVKLTTSGEFVRAAKGGLGAVKTPANYAASLLAGERARKAGFTQVLWLDAVEHKYVEEVGAMNVFFYFEGELATPELGGALLSGVTRDCVIRLATDMGVKVAERRVSIDEVFAASMAGTLKEVFGTGTAAVISPVGSIHHNGAEIKINGFKPGALALKLYDAITSIQYGESADKYRWCHLVNL